MGDPITSKVKLHQGEWVSTFIFVYLSSMKNGLNSLDERNSDWIDIHGFL